MIEGRNIVCVASAWNYDPTSKHHIMRILSRRNKIVWVTYRGTRRPSATLADARAVSNVLKSAARGIREVAPSIMEVTPLVIPGAKSRAAKNINEKMLSSRIRRALRAVDPAGARPTQVWTFAPDIPYLVHKFDEECFVYYCVDEFAEFQGVDTNAIRLAERETLCRADVILATSDHLFSTRRTVRPDTVLCPHGVDYEHFALAWKSPPPLPPSLRSITSPMFGFFGMIEHWVDVNLIANVAKLRPQYSFVLLGECRTRADVIERLPNVHLLGRRSYRDLPAYCAAFRAGLMPFRLTNMTRAVNPIKLHEYLAAGLPVIGTSIPEARRYHNLVTIADTPEDFAVACDNVREREASERATIARAVQHQTWEARVEHISDVIMQRVNGLPRSRSREDVMHSETKTHQPERTAATA